MFSTEAKIRVISFQRRLQMNPNDAEALYGLSVSYRYGWGGLPQNNSLADDLLQESARLGDPDACRELNRINASMMIMQAFHDRDIREIRKAKDIFDKRQGLREAIEHEIFPCVVSLITGRGITGSAFFQHSEWLVSNAHVLPSLEVLEDSRLIDFKYYQTPLEVKRAFHRPSEIATSPDIIVINGNSRGENNNKCIPINFTADNDCGGRIVFYVYFNLEKRIHEIKYLIPRSKTNAYPMIYECEDGVEPLPGCSGAPVIEVRLLVGGHEIKWQFKTIGIVYARFPSQNGRKLACVIPVKQDFQQILETIIHPEMFAKRSNQMAHAYTYIRNSDGKKITHLVNARNHTIQAHTGLQEFEVGKTSLNINLPEGLEKLLGKTIIDLQCSVFLIEIQKKYGINDKVIQRNAKTLEELCDDFCNFLGVIRSQKLMPTLPKGNGNNFFLSPKGYFRIDVGGGTHGPFVLDIQDNIGKRGQHAPPPHNTEPISSKFAIASVPKEKDKISGAELVDLFEASLTSNSRQLVQSTRSARTVVQNERTLPMWRAYCDKHGNNPWIGTSFNTEAEALNELENTEHITHGGRITVKK